MQAKSMQLLSITNLSKSYGDNQVLNNVSLKIYLGQRVGLVGANGVGKSTLLKIVVDALEPDSGQVLPAPQLDVGYLPQVLEMAERQTIAQLVDVTLGNLRQMEVRLRQLEGEMASALEEDVLAQILAEYSELSEQFERKGGYDLDHRRDQVFEGLGIAHLAQDRLVRTLSGGEKSRVGLAALLLRSPDLLMLDEPTNHLDFTALAWLESYLQSYQGGMLVVSHDRHFLNKTVQSIVEIDEHSREAKVYTGDYDAYAHAKAQERVKWEEAYWQQMEEVWELRRVVKGKARQVAHNRPARDGDKMAYDAKGARVQSAIARNVRAAEEKLRRIAQDPIPKPPQAWTINPEFNPLSLPSKTPLSATQLSKSYTEQTILNDITFSLSNSGRIVIIGPNGAGKSTLLKILGDVVQPDSGEVHRSSSTVIGYLDQEQETLETSGTIFDAYRADRIGEWEDFK
ncbi:MAG: ABC-F family ATP-binding cassette domain-containing protein, partial [Chloroflexota bacterium]